MVLKTFVLSVIIMLHFQLQINKNKEVVGEGGQHSKHQRDAHFFSVG